MRLSSFRFLISVLLGLGFILPLAMVSARAEGVLAVTVNDLNMREGPGTRYRPVLLIPRGARVPVMRCTDRYAWCEVGYAGRAGWVAARYLRDTRPRYDDRPISDIGAVIGLQLFNFVLNELADRDRRPSDTGGYGRPGGGYGGSGGGYGSRDPGPNEVCFFEDANFRGRSFCASMGDSDRRLGDFWNDRISSIRVGRRAAVRVCEHENFGGWCQTVSDDIRLFPGSRNDAISSYEVRRSGGGGNWGGGGGNWGGGGGDWGGGRSKKACFFEHANFQGARICFDAGEGTARLPPNWNDRISSIKLQGGARARVCQHENFGGWCEIVRGDAARFSERHNDEISSIEVF